MVATMMPSPFTAKIRLNVRGGCRQTLSMMKGDPQI
jgi:hypothetical protein